MMVAAYDAGLWSPVAPASRRWSPWMSHSGLRARIGEAWRTLKDDEGDFGVDEDAFAASIQATIAAQGEAIYERLVLADVYLALGCLGRNDCAVRRFLERFGDYLSHLARRDAPNSAAADDIEAELLATLFLPRKGEDVTTARLYGYRGMGTLQGWLRVTARRLVIDLIRKQKRHEGEERLERVPTPVVDAQHRLVSLDAAWRLRHIFVAVVESLSPEERDLMRRYYRDGQVLREIGADLGIDTTSAYRRIAAIRTKMFKRFRSQAQSELGLGERDLKALLSDLADGLDLGSLFNVLLFLVGLIELGGTL